MESFAYSTSRKLALALSMIVVIVSIQLIDDNYLKTASVWNDSSWLSMPFILILAAIYSFVISLIVFLPLMIVVGIDVSIVNSLKKSSLDFNYIYYDDFFFVRAAIIYPAISILIFYKFKLSHGDFEPLLFLVFPMLMLSGLHLSIDFSDKRAMAADWLEKYCLRHSLQGLNDIVKSYVGDAQLSENLFSLKSHYLSSFERKASSKNINPLSFFGIGRKRSSHDSDFLNLDDYDLRIWVGYVLPVNYFGEKFSIEDIGLPKSKVRNTWLKKVFTSDVKKNFGFSDEYIQNALDGASGSKEATSLLNQNTVDDILKLKAFALLPKRLTDSMGEDVFERWQESGAVETLLNVEEQLQR